MTEIQDPNLRPLVTGLMRLTDGTDEHAFVVEAIRERRRLREDLVESQRERIRLAETIHDLVAKNPGKLGNRIGRLEKKLAEARESAETAHRTEALTHAVMRDNAEKARALADQQHRAIQQIHDRINGAMEAMIDAGLGHQEPARLEAALHLAVIKDAIAAYEERYPHATSR